MNSKPTYTVIKARPLGPRSVFHLKYQYGKTYTIPKEWVAEIKETLSRKGCTLLKTSKWQKGLDGDLLFSEGPAEAFCKMYLDTMDKTVWPTLLGMSPIMDREIGRRAGE